MNKEKFVGFAAVAVILFISGSQGAEPPRDYFQEGQAAYTRGDYPLAVDRATEALIRGPGDKRSQRLLVAASQKIIEQEKANQMSLDDLRRMVSEANKVLDDRQKEIRRVMDELKIAERESGKLTPEETLRACRGVDLLLEVTLGEDPESKRFRAYLHSVCGNLKTALDRGILLRPEDERRVMGYVAFCRSDWNTAVSSWGEALKIQPKDEHLRELWTSAKAKQVQQESEKRITQWINDSNAAIAAHRDEEALLILRGALKDYPGEERLVGLYEKTLERVSKRARDRMTTAQRKKAMAHQNAGRWVDAAQSWLALLKEDPLNMEARENLDLIRRRLEGTGGRIAVAPKTLPPDVLQQSEKFYTLGLIRYAEGDLDKASAQFKSCLKINPGHDYARKALERVEEERRPSR
jgi:tetratricopeptide (TPR) repeat protein